jgi:hypothetical protein
VTHKIESIHNSGWDDDPSWQAICECSWETWGHLSEIDAKERHAEHSAEMLIVGQCSCPTCVAEASGETAE